jgi:hypothetical protein
MRRGKEREGWKKGPSDMVRGKSGEKRKGESAVSASPKLGWWKAQRSNDARRGGRPRGVAATRACRTAIARSPPRALSRRAKRLDSRSEKRRSLEISREPRKPPGCLLVGRSTHQEAGVGHAGGGDALVVRSVRGGGGHDRGSLRDERSSGGKGTRGEREGARTPRGGTR